MTSLLVHALHAMRTDRRLQESVFSTLCWLGFASVVIASVALPA